MPISFGWHSATKKGVVILVNKWDLVEKDTHTTKHFEEGIRKIIAPFTDVPIIFISALTKQRIYKAIEKAVEVYNNRSQRIKTSVLNEYMLPIIEATPPPATKGKYIKIKYCMQLPTDLPQFVFLLTFPNISRILTAALWRTSSERSLTLKGYLWIFSLGKSREF